MKRALRRWHKQRMKALARKRWPWSWKAHHYADNMKVSSTCRCCINPRVYEGKTRKEIIIDLDLKEYEDQH